MHDVAIKLQWLTRGTDVQQPKQPPLEGNSQINADMMQIQKNVNDQEKKIRGT